MKATYRGGEEEDRHWGFHCVLPVVVLWFWVPNKEIMYRKFYFSPALLSANSKPTCDGQAKEPLPNVNLIPALYSVKNNNVEQMMLE